jgi:protein-tyrosine phosphatase
MCWSLVPRVCDHAVVSERKLAWDGCLNVRDLGGHATEGGGRTRYGAVVRADSVRSLTDAGWESLVAHGIRRIVDLRLDRERAEDAPREVPVEVVHVQVVDETAPGAAEVLEATQTTEAFYLAILELFHERWARAVAAVGDAPAGGVVVHCHGGKDRTGIVAALLLRLVGVPTADVAADYGETTRNLAELNTAWIAAAEDEEERERRILFSRSEPETMEAVVRELERRHGSVRAYLLAGGATEEELERVETRLLD